MRFIARANAPTYPDADQIATTIPATSANPAAGEFAKFSIGPRMTSTVEPGATSCTMPSIASTPFLPWPKTPRSDTIAISPGNRLSTP
jgi:hypothetical protein